MRQDVKDMSPSALVGELAAFVVQAMRFDALTPEDWARHREVQAELDRRLA